MNRATQLRVFGERTELGKRVRSGRKRESTENPNECCGTENVSKT